MRLSRQALSRQVASVVIAFVATLSALALPADAKVGGINGQIVFARFSPALNGTVVYTINPDGSGMERLSPGNFKFGGEEPHWSPDGSKVVFISPAPPDLLPGLPNVFAVIANVDTGTFQFLPIQEPATLFTDCHIWSPDAARLACNGGGQTDPSLNGIYTVRSSDGGGLTRLTSDPGGIDEACDYSPDGTQLAFSRTNPDGSTELNTVNVGTGVVQQLAPAGTTLSSFQCGSWSPQGNQIVFAARPDAGHRRAIYVVNSDGIGLHQISISPSCGGAASDPTSRGCLDPAWSPDGTKIVFRIFAPGIKLNNPVYTANADGSGLFQVTHTGAINSGEGDAVPDWGTHAATG